MNIKALKILIEAAENIGAKSIYLSNGRDGVENYVKLTATLEKLGGQHDMEIALVFYHD